MTERDHPSTIDDPLFPSLLTHNLLSIIPRSPQSLLSWLSTSLRSSMATPVAPSRGQSPAPLYRRQPLRIACAQYDVKVRPLRRTRVQCVHEPKSDPQLGRVEDNVKKVEALTSR